MDTIQPIEYTNRRGKTYYLFQGKTKKGNPRYFFSPSATGGKTECVPLDRIPEGFELFEHPNSNVLLRKKVKTDVLPRELFFVREQVEELEREDKDLNGNSLFDDPLNSFSSQVEQLLKSSGISLPENFKFKRRTPSHVWRYRAEVVEDSIIVYEVRFNQANEMLRFELIDKEARRYSASRWVFTGSGRWRSLRKTGTIEEVATEYCPHMNTDAFYEML